MFNNTVVIDPLWTANNSIIKNEAIQFHLQHKSKCIFFTARNTVTNVAYPSLTSEILDRLECTLRGFSISKGSPSALHRREPAVWVGCLPTRTLRVDRTDCECIHRFDDVSTDTETLRDRLIPIYTKDLMGSCLAQNHLNKHIERNFVLELLIRFVEDFLVGKGKCGVTQKGLK